MHVGWYFFLVRLTNLPHTSTSIIVAFWSHYISPRWFVSGIGKDNEWIDDKDAYGRLPLILIINTSGGTQ